jgi:uptake hydrogenase large subunit
MTRYILKVPVNRVEGDLEVNIQIESGTIIDAWCSGVMYRGFENIMKDRGPLDGLVITPRICGICSTAHLAAAAAALDGVYKTSPPDQGLRIRNIALGVESIQNDIRHFLMMFMSDFSHSRYAAHPMFNSSSDRYTPLKGSRILSGLEATRQLIEIIGIIGGQWPHSSFMVPGGVVTVPTASEITQCRHLLRTFKKWYENQVLGCPVEAWNAVQSSRDLDQWIAAKADHAESDIGFFIRFSKDIGLDRTGRGHGNFINSRYFGLSSESDPQLENTAIHVLTPYFVDAGGHRQPLNQESIKEDIASSWFDDTETCRHPFEGRTKPYATGDESGKYSWCKAPRYNGLPAETGPLAQMVAAQDPLFVDLLAPAGPNTFIRQLARMARPAKMLPAVLRWIEDVAAGPAKFFNDYKHIEDGEGFGLVEAPRGILGHWLRVANNRIQHYQVITPTAWNASPRDGDRQRGPIEEALIGTPLADPKDPIEAGYVIRSFDPCLVCTVHAIVRE